LTISRRSFRGVVRCCGSPFFYHAFQHFIFNGARSWRSAWAVAKNATCSWLSRSAAGCRKQAVGGPAIERWPGRAVAFSDFDDKLADDAEWCRWRWVWAGKRRAKAARLGRAGLGGLIGATAYVVILASDFAGRSSRRGPQEVGEAPCYRGGLGLGF